MWPVLIQTLLLEESSIALKTSSVTKYYICALIYMYNNEVSIVTIQLRFKAIIILINNFVVSVYTVKTPVLKCIMVERYHQSQTHRWSRNLRNNRMDCDENLYIASIKVGF